MWYMYYFQYDRPYLSSQGPYHAEYIHELNLHVVNQLLGQEGVYYRAELLHHVDVGDGDDLLELLAHLAVH